MGNINAVWTFPNEKGERVILTKNMMGRPDGRAVGGTPKKEKEAKNIVKTLLDKPLERNDWLMEGVASITDKKSESSTPKAKITYGPHEITLKLEGSGLSERNLQKFPQVVSALTEKFYNVTGQIDKESDRIRHTLMAIIFVLQSEKDSDDVKKAFIEQVVDAFTKTVSRDSATSTDKTSKAQCKNRNFLQYLQFFIFHAYRALKDWMLYPLRSFARFIEYAIFMGAASGDNSDEATAEV